MKRNLKQGQIGLLLLVVLGLVISIVLSIAAKSLSDVVLSRQEKENNVAFALAETGVEEALRAINQNSGEYTGTLGAGGIVIGQYDVDEIQGLDIYLKAGEQAEMDLTGYLGATLTIKWTRTNDSSENPACTSEGEGNAPAAIEVIAIKSDQSVEREYYNAFNCSLANNFDPSVEGSDGFLSQLNYALPSGTNWLRVRPYYSGATIQVEGTGLTTQMYLVKSGAEGGDANKEIEVKRSRDSASSIFDYALFSGSSIIK